MEETKHKLRIVVNTTKNISWIVATIDSSIHYDPILDPEFVVKIREAVLSLPTRIKLPAHVSISLPRYYLIQLRLDTDVVNIIDIVGVRKDLTPTKWGYRFGYWHPQCQILIANALTRYIQTLPPKP